MGWSIPATWVAGTVVTADNMNTYIRDQQRYLKGIGQVPTIESGLTIDNTDGDERLLLPLLSTAECTTVLNAEGEVAFDEQTHRIKIYDNDGVESLVSTADVDDTPVNGATTDPVSSNWAYDFINTLTTQSDLPYATAAGVWARLAKGTATQFLRMNSGATAPEWVNGSTNVSKLQSHTRDMTAASGDVAYTSYGFQPSAIIIFACVAANRLELSFGFGDDDLGEMCIAQEGTGGAFGAQTAQIVYLYEAAGKSQGAVLKTLDADGFTLTWTKTGTTSAGTANLIVLALA